MRFVLRLSSVVALLAALSIQFPSSPALAQAKPFGLPFDTAPGPSTWLVGQMYGNTTGAYRWRRVMYGAGQGLHFGIDFSARCGTPVVAIGDGVVTKVDAASHGAGPHNLMIDHPNGYASFYGHLVERASVDVGQPVARGQVVGYTGDPDLTCSSRPHLHLEIRSGYNYRTAYNPVPLIDADWDSLMLTGAFQRGYQRDLAAPRQWQFADEQPEIQFGGPILNDYSPTWPPEWLNR